MPSVGPYWSAAAGCRSRSRRVASATCVAGKVKASEASNYATDCQYTGLTRTRVQHILTRLRDERHPHRRLTQT